MSDKFKKNLTLFLLFSLSFFVRFWKLGEIPQGLSLKEIDFGLSMSKSLGSWVLNPFFIRLPFAILGFFSLILFFLFLSAFAENHDRKIVDECEEFSASAGFRSRRSGRRRYQERELWGASFKVKGFSLAFWGTLLLALTPWHIQESRIYSEGIIILLVVIFLSLVFSKYIFSHKVSRFLLLSSFVIFTVSVFVVPKEVRDIVNTERFIARKSDLIVSVELFSNKLVGSVRERTNVFFDNLDFGNLFFAGHPRERWGIEEIVKVPITFLIFIFLGLISLDRKYVLFIISSFFLFCALLSFFGLSDPSSSLVLLFPISIIVSFGALKIFGSNNLRTLGLILSLLFFFEFFYFWKNYEDGTLESIFASRRPVYKDLVDSVVKLKQPDEKVSVTTRLGTPEKYFRFYLKDIKLKDFEFKDYDIRENSSDRKLFVDILPDNPNPSEPLYVEGGGLPKNLNLLAEFYDTKLRQKVFVYRLKW